MTTLKLDQTKAVIEGSSLDQLFELVAMLKARLQSLGFDGRALNELINQPFPSAAKPPSWQEIEDDLAEHAAGKTGVSLGELRRL